jgi:hypothetical protein
MGMKRLGEILLDRGAIAVAELHTGLEACHHSEGRLGTQLLKFGFVDEHALLEALSEQLEVPPISAVILRRAPDELRRLVPLHVARRLQVVVFERKNENLGVAMTTPRSPAALEEVISYVGLDIVPHVGTEIGILTALAEVREASEMSVAEPNGHGFIDEADEWQFMWTPPALQSTDLLRPRKRPESDDLPMAATFPELAPVPAGGDGATPEYLDDETLGILLRDAKNRDEVGDFLLRRAAAILGRCCLLAVHSGRVVGWLARGAGVVVDDVQSFIAPLDMPSVLSELGVSGSFCGRVPPGQINDQMTQTLGYPAPSEVVIFPVLVKNRIVAFLLGDSPGSKVSPDEREQLVLATRKAGIAFEILIMRKKILV